jgi:type I restriction enzyme M protein
VRISVLLFPCGTGGFLLAALDFVIDNYDMDKEQKKHLKSDFVRGWELVPNTARMEGTLIRTNLH